MKFKLLHFEINKILLFSLLGILLMCSAASANVPVTSGLVAEYDFVTIDGSTLVDISGNNRNGIIIDATSTSEGLAFSGSSQYVDLGKQLGDLSEYTIIVAQKENTINGSSGTVFSQYDSAKKVGFKIDKSFISGDSKPQYYRVFYANATDPDNIKISSLGFSQRYAGWGTIHARCDSNTVSAGVDGRQETSQNLVSVSGQAYPAYIGKHLSYYYNGTIGYMCVYNRCLNDTELDANLEYIRLEMATRGVELPEARRPFNPGYMVLTFDDGFKTDYSTAYPILSELGVPATIYVIGSVIGTDYGGERLNWDEIKLLRDANWGVEDHTYKHVMPITTLDNETLISELEAVNDVFTNHLMPTPEHISYPGTAADERTVEIIKDYRDSGRGYHKRSSSVLAVVEWDEPEYWGYDGWYRVDQIGFSGFSGMSTAVKTAIDEAATMGYTIFPYTHAVSDDVGVDPETFREVITYAMSKGFDPITVDGFYRAMHGIRTYPYQNGVLTGQTTPATHEKTVDYVGFVWGTDRHNNPENVTASASGYDQYWVSAPGSYVEQNFTHSVSFSEKTYYRAVAHINGTWVYGEEMTYDPMFGLPYIGSSLSHTVIPGGYIKQYNRTLSVSDARVPLSIYPTAGAVIVTVSTWETDHKVWTESSEDHSIAVTHVIGGFPANTDIQIKCDDINYKTATSNETGYIEWVYDGGFETDYTFSIECHDFNASLTSGAYPLTTQFTTSSDGIDAYYWDFENDGIIDSTKQNPAHTYGQTGDYSVNLTVHTSEGNVSTVKPDYITVSAPAFASDPVAWFNWVFSYLFGRF